MEDGFERSRCNLLNEHMNEDMNEHKNEHNNNTNILYVCIPRSEKWEDYIITNSKEQIAYLSKKNYRIEIFEKDNIGNYKSKSS
jgi:hypothetical protein